MARKRSTTVALAIITKNERLSSEVIFPQIPLDTLDEVIVVDGNSKDGTKEYYQQKKIRVFTQKTPGLGAATLLARRCIKSDAMIIFHPDGNENPKDIAKCANALRNGKVFVIPSRMIKGGKNEEDDQLLKPRKWFNLLLTFCINWIWGEPFRYYVTEIVQGFRAIRCDAFDILKLDTNGPAIDSQMVIRALKYKFPIYEFPTIEGKRLFGETKFKSLPTGIANLKIFFREIIDPKTYPTKLSCLSL